MCRTPLLTPISIVLTASLSSFAPCQPRFEIIDLNDISYAGFASPWSINDEGVIAGVADFGVLDGFTPTVWIDGHAQPLRIVPGDDIGALVGANLNGLAVGESTWIEERPNLLIFHSTATLWTSLDAVEIDSLVTTGQDWDLLYCAGLNDNGVIIGTGRDPVLEEPRAWIFDSNTGALRDMGTLGGFSTEPYAINNSGVIVGQSWTSGGQQHAFVLENGVMTDLGTLGGRDSRATDINESGLVVGGAQSPTSPELAVRWDGGQMFVLGTLGGNQSNANGVNNRGEIVGFSTDVRHYAHMFYWRDGVMYNPVDHIPPGGGWGGRANALDINDAGQFVGTMYRENRGDAPAVLTLVELELEGPLPGSAGQFNEVTVSGAAPGSLLTLVFGDGPGLRRIPGCPGAPILIDEPLRAAVANADGNGVAVIRGFVPASARGRAVRLQAVERSRCRVSNVIEHTFF
ncbi:MAG: hypothetical protein ACF8PN_00260 [Phycisphaerales bacterium]